MLNYLIKRLFSTVPVLIGISLLLFFMLRMLPGDPAQVLAGQMATPQEIENIRKQLGLDRPVYEQYANYLSRLVRFDLGRSARTQNPVLEEIWARLPNTLLLAVVAISLACLFGIPAGIISAVRPYSWIDYLVTTSALFGMSMPVFWLGMLLWILVADVFGYPYRSGRAEVTGFATELILFESLLRLKFDVFAEHFSRIFLPAITLSTIPMAVITRMTRSAMLEELRKDYATTARAKGLSGRRVVLKHVLRNALIPITTITGLQFGTLLGGAVLTETVFSWPGLGLYIVEDGVRGSDAPIIVGGILLVSTTFVLINLVVDLTYALIDPRIRSET